MLVAQVFSLVLSATISFLICKSGLAIWRSLLATLLALPVGAFLGIVAGGYFDDPYNLHIYSTSFWFGLFGTIIGVFYGRKQANAKIRSSNNS